MLFNVSDEKYKSQRQTTIHTEENRKPVDTGLRKYDYLCI
jgi:hypothetical protein